MGKTNYYLNKFRSAQEPTKFQNGFNTRFFAEDPIYVGFSMFFDLNSPLFNPPDNFYNESAERYFLNNDDDERAGYVKELRNRITSLIFDHQYFLQKISGIDTLYLKDIGGDKIEIEIETLESLDMRITKIKELFRLITYDYDGEKQILPDNLQWMNVNILINDCRNIGKFIDGEIVDITPSLDTIIHTIKECRFDITNHSYAGEISNSEPEFGSNSFKIIGGHSHMNRSRMSLLEALTNDVGTSPSMVRMSLRTGYKEDSQTLDKLNQEKLVEENQEKKEIHEENRSDVETDNNKSKISSNNDKKFSHKKGLDDMLKSAGKSVIKSVKSEVEREIRDRLNNLLNDKVKKSGLNNVFFRGGGVEALATGNVIGLIKAAINNNLLPTLSVDIASLILNDKKLSKAQNISLVQEILKVSDKKLGNVFDR